VPRELTIYRRMLNYCGEDAWIIDDFGCLAAAWERFAAADTLVYIELPLTNHHRWGRSDRDSVGAGVTTNAAAARPGCARVGRTQAMSSILIAEAR